MNSLQARLRACKQAYCLVLGAFGSSCWADSNSGSVGHGTWSMLATRSKQAGAQSSATSLKVTRRLTSEVSNSKWRRNSKLRQTRIQFTRPVTSSEAVHVTLANMSVEMVHVGALPAFI